MFLLDIDVVYELRRVRPHGAVIVWLSNLPSHHICLSGVTIGEIRSGITITCPGIEDAAERHRFPLLMSGPEVDLTQKAYDKTNRGVRNLLSLGALAALLLSLQACQTVKFEGLATPLDKSFQQRLADRADK